MAPWQLESLPFSQEVTASASQETGHVISLFHTWPRTTAGHVNQGPRAGLAPVCRAGQARLAWGQVGLDCRRGQAVGCGNGPGVLSEPAEAHRLLLKVWWEGRGPNWFIPLTLFQRSHENSGFCRVSLLYLPTNVPHPLQPGALLQHVHNARTSETGGTPWLCSFLLIQSTDVLPLGDYLAHVPETRGGKGLVQVG